MVYYKRIKAQTKTKNKKERYLKMTNTVSKNESIALNPVIRPKNNQQFMARRTPYWKTSEYREMRAKGLVK